MLTQRKINELVRHQVVISLREVLSDPDFGLELKKITEKRLKKSINSKKRGRVKSLNEILGKYL